MLARRALCRSFVHLRHDALNNRRPVPQSLPLCAHYYGRPPTLSGKLWFKSDGTPRSKIKGLIAATLASGTLFTIYSAVTLVQELDTINYLLNLLVLVQRIDTDLPSINFDDYFSTRLYFLHLVNPFLGDIPQDAVDAFTDAVYSIPESLHEGAHRVMREACEGVHEILVRDRSEDPYETAVNVVKKMNEEMNRLADLVEDANSDEFSKVLRSSKMKEQIMRDHAVGKSEDYEVVG